MTSKMTLLKVAILALVSFATSLAVFADDLPVTVEKMVRNISNPSSGEGRIVNGNRYFPVTTPVLASSGDVLEYVFIVTGLPKVTIGGVKIKDILPVYLTYVPESTLLNGSSQGVQDVAGVSPLMSGVLVNDASSTVNSGKIAAGTSAIITYQVKVITY